MVPSPQEGVGTQKPPARPEDILHPLAEPP